MRHRFAMVVAIALGAAGLNTGAQAQSSMPCDAFIKNADGSWSAMRNVYLPGADFKVQQGALFRPNMSIRGLNVAAALEQECPSVAATAAAAQTQVEITKFADVNGDIDIQRLTCGQLADTYQEDADLLLAWYSGWSNGVAKRQMINVARVKQGVHDVIVYCKANKDKLLAQAIESILKEARR